MEYSELLGKLRKSPLKTKTLALSSLKDAYIFHDGNFWKVVKVGDVLTLQECQVQERSTLMSHPGMILLTTKEGISNERERKIAEHMGERDDIG